MKISLRKAKALQTAIFETINSFPVATTVELNEFDNAEEIIAAAKNQFETSSALRLSLWVADYQIRKLVGRANVKFGISDRLTDKAMYEKLISETQDVLSHVLAHCTMSVIKSKQNKLKTSVSSYTSFETLSTGILTEENLLNIKNTLSSLKKKKQEISDQLIELNIKTTIDIDNETADVLKFAGII